MFRVAVIVFPGTNCEGETRRSLRNAGLAAEFVRWNERNRLDAFDAFVLPGGFAYEDRSRAGIIAAQDPIMENIKKAALAGKPVIGICNGCQILVESGLLPGLPNNALAGAVAMNTRVQNSRIIGTGFYHDTIYMNNVAPKGRSCITTEMEQGAVIPATVANGEGRFLFPSELLVELEERGQIIFQFCTKDGNVVNEFPITPNGAVRAIAGLCNPAGNVVAYMPHPERLEREGNSLFVNLRSWLEKPQQKPSYSLKWQPPETKINTYQPRENALQFYVSSIITDNAAKTVELTMKQKKFPVQLERQTHWEVWLTPKADPTELTGTLVQTGELLNTNKETYSQTTGERPQTVSFLIRSSEDYEGQSVAKILQDRFGMQAVEQVRKGTVWHIILPADQTPQERQTMVTEILQTCILFNPYAQECALIR